METSNLIDSYRQPQIYFIIQNVHDTHNLQNFWIPLSVQNRPKLLSPIKKFPIQSYSQACPQPVGQDLYSASQACM